MAIDGAAAISRAISLQPDVIVMDDAMPRMSGVDATRLLKADPRTRRVPIIMVSGDGIPSAIQRALDAGIDAYLPKPCRPEDLAREIRKQLGGLTTWNITAAC